MSAGMTVSGAPAAEVPTGGGASRRWLVADAAAMTGRELARWRRQPGPALVGLLFPVLLVLMFGYLFGGQMGAALGTTGDSGQEYRSFLVPGVLVMTMLFGLEQTMLSVGLDVGRGITDRFRSMAVHPVSILAGRAVADLLFSCAGLLVMVAAGLAVGWRWHGSPSATAAAFGLLLLLRFALTWTGIWLGLVAGGPEAVVAVQILVWPVGFLSAVFADPATMPGWLGTVATWNPLTATVLAVRDLFGNPSGAVGEGWIATNPVSAAVLWPVLLLVVFVPLAATRYRSLSR